jgi:hypothetical protein
MIELDLKDFETKLKKLKLNKNDILIIKLGDKDLGYIPSYEQLVEYKNRIKAFLKELGLEDNKVIATHPFIEFQIIRNPKEKDLIIVKVGDVDKGILPNEKEINTFAEFLNRLNIESNFIVVNPIISFTKISKIKYEELMKKKFESLISEMIEGKLKEKAKKLYNELFIKNGN